MKCFTEAELMEKLVEAYKRGAEDTRRFNLKTSLSNEQMEYRLRDIVHEDAGGHDGWGKKHG